METIQNNKNDIKKVNFYEGSTLFSTETTNLNVNESFIEYKLAKQYEYRPTIEDLWATIIQDGKELSRFSFAYGLGLTQIVF